MRWNRFPVPLIHARGEESVVHLQTTPLTPADVLLVGKVHTAVRLWMNAKRTLAKMMVIA